MNNVLVIGFTVAMIVYLYVVPAEKVPERKTLRVVLLIWGSFVIYNNVKGWLPSGGADYEFIGFALFLCSLGYVVARRSLRTEEGAVWPFATNWRLRGASRRRSCRRGCPSLPDCRWLHSTSRCRRWREISTTFSWWMRGGLECSSPMSRGTAFPAALVASMVKVAIAAQSEHADDPAKVMTGLNSVLAGKLQGQFVTAAYLFLDLESGTGRYSAAGHPPLLHYCCRR